MNKFVEICQQTTQCMQTPQQDSAGWLIWTIWILALVLVVCGFISSADARRAIFEVLRNPTEYRGRIGREEFLSVYYPLQVLRCSTVLAIILATAMLSHSRWVYVPLFLGGGLLLCASAALYCVIIRRGHDFGFGALESMQSYLLGAHLLKYLNKRFDLNGEKTHTWSILCSNKGSPFANLYGSAPAENNYLLSGRADEFQPPLIWDKMDWKNTQK
ncbi:MAG: DUF805 domain-containing protein [Elusimicrobiaceae bacterium]|nr:DUF805 domain-containing protein [Elusimicrobiaceae bacterium]MBP5616934.1 DUF805 domain-containing protein [Elusimicrobiaceae bacterium]